MGNWKTCELGDLLTFQRGHDLSKSQVVAGKYPIAGSNGIIGYHNKFTTKAPSITIGRSGNIGNPHLYTVDFWAHNTALYIKEFKNSDPKFIFYLLKTLDFTGHNSGSAVPSLNRNFIHPMKVFVPESIEEQKAIAKILSSLDDKIKLNRQMNATLEAMARALFKAWFVDFEPVRANSENRPSTSAPSEIAKLFPSEFENDIPKDWKLSSIGEEVDAVGGGTPSTKEPSYWNGEYKWITPKDLSNLTDKVLISSERTITSEGLAKISSGELPKETVLLSSRAPVGYLAISKIPVAINQGFIAMKCNKLLPSSYVLQWAEQSMDKIKNRASGTTFAEISKANFRPLPIIVPSKIVIEKYDGLCKLIYDQITNNAKENEILSQIRDELLPKLIQGKIRVPIL